MSGGIEQVEMIIKKKKKKEFPENIICLQKIIRKINLQSK